MSVSNPGSAATPDASQPTAAKVQTGIRTYETDDVTLTSGQLQLSGPVTLRAGQPYSAANFISGATASVGLAHSWAALIRISDRQIMAVSADDTSNWTALTKRTFTFAAAYTPVAGEDHMLGLMVAVATTMPTVRGKNGSIISYTDLPILAASANGGLTTPLPVTTIVNAFTVSNAKPYAFVT